MLCTGVALRNDDVDALPGVDTYSVDDDDEDNKGVDAAAPALVPADCDNEGVGIDAGSAEAAVSFMFLT